MARRTAALKPQLNQIRTWARDGRTDAWIAFQLGTTAATVQEFRSEHGLDKGGGNPAEEPVTPEHVVQTISFDTPPPVIAPAPSSDEPDGDAATTRTRRQRRSRPTSADAAATAEGDVASSDEAAAETVASGEAEPAERTKRRRRRGGRGGGAATGESAAGGEPATADEQPLPAETPARASSKRRPRTPASYEGSVVAGAVIVLDPAIARSAAWRAHWADGPAFDVVIDDEQIVLRRRTQA